MTRVSIQIEAELDLDEDGLNMLNLIRAESPGEELDWLNDRLRDEQHAWLQSYEMSYDIEEQS